jgi:putative NADH-flavin reductase
MSHAKVIVFGASRGVGRAFTELALAQGHRVTAVVRDPATLAPNHECLEVAAGDVSDRRSVRRHLDGHDMAFCTVGADTRGATTLYSDAAGNIADAMGVEGVRRLMFLSNFGVLGEKGRGIRTAAMVSLTKRLLRPTLEDHRRALDELTKHDLRWIAVRPMALTDGARTGEYRIVEDGLPKGGTRISRADVADFMLKQLDSDAYVHRVPAIAY